MKGNRLEKMALLLTDYCMEVREAEKVLLVSSFLAMPLLKELYKICLERGAFPDVRISGEGLAALDYQYGSDAFLQSVSPFSEAEFGIFHKRLNIGCSYNTNELAGVSSEKQAMRMKASGKLREVMNRREAAGEFSWCVTAFPCQASAQDAEMSLDGYEEYMARALMLDHDDPIQAWKDFEAYQQGIIEHLRTKSEIIIKGVNANLKLNVKGRTWVNANGKGNMPDGEVFTAPHEDSANGWINYNYPCRLFGQEVVNIRFEYENGRVVKASAEKGEEAVLRMLNMDEGMKYIGEFAFGTNYGIERFIRNGLFDEKRGGTMHIANGATLEGTGGTNKAPVHWDNITEIQDAEVFADGEMIYRNGKFLFI